MTDSMNPTGKCRKCGVPLNEAAPGSPVAMYCAGCRISLAEEQIAVDNEKTDEPRKRKWLWPVLKIAVLATALGVIAVQYPRLMTAFDAPKPIRQGSYATDVGADRCIGNLWFISKGLGENKKAPEDGMVCPASGQPYRAENVEGNRIVNCPDPKLHGLSFLRVSRKNPVPEARP
jgi:hypothetical protein